MRIRVKLFADLRETVGVNELELELGAAATIDEAWGALVQRQPLLAARRANLATAVNRRYVRWEEQLQDGDELVFVPPVSGG